MKFDNNKNIKFSKSIKRESAVNWLRDLEYVSKNYPGVAFALIFLGVVACVLFLWIFSGTIENNIASIKDRLNFVSIESTNLKSDILELQKELRKIKNGS